MVLAILDSLNIILKIVLYKDVRQYSNSKEYT